MEKCDILDCSFNKAVELIKSRFVCAIIVSLSEESATFSILSSEYSYLTNATLSRTLKKLCDDGLVIKDDNLYKLTPAGVELVAIIESLDEWYEKHF